MLSACVCPLCSVLQASSWVEQEQLDERLAEMEGQKAQLAADLQATQVGTAGQCAHMWPWTFHEA